MGPYGQKIWLPNVATTFINPGEWHRIEFHYKWGAAGDGIIQWWVDGVLNGTDARSASPSRLGFSQFEFAPTIQIPPATSSTCISTTPTSASRDQMESCSHGRRCAVLGLLVRTSKSLVDQLRCAGHTVEAGTSTCTEWIGCSAPRRRFRPTDGAGNQVSPQRRAVPPALAQRRPPYCRSPRNSGFRPADRRHVPAARSRHSSLLPVLRFEHPDGQHGTTWGHSDAVSLTARELGQVAQRELEIYRGAAGIFTLSERLRRSFVEDFDLPSSRVHAVHAGPNFDVTRIPRDTTRDDPSHAPTILFVGRQFHRKGGDLLVEAFRRVRERIPEARLMIAGPPSPPVRSQGSPLSAISTRTTRAGGQPSSRRTDRQTYSACRLGSSPLASRSSRRCASACLASAPTLGQYRR